MSDWIYLDYNATTPCDPRVVQAMLPYFSEKFGNAASRTHAYGWEANEAVETARAQVAALIGAKPSDIYFTSGATESNNLAVRGLALANRQSKRHIVTVQTEHKALLEPCLRLEREEGFEITQLPVQRDGLIDLDQLADALRPDTLLVSIMTANNETGVIQPMEQIGLICRSHHVALHTDATQSVGKMVVNVDSLNVQLMSLSAHKVYGPKGIGALYVRRKAHLRMAPLLDGGGHERGLRAGTLNVPAIVGFGHACVLAGQRLDREAERISQLRDRLRAGIFASLHGVYENGHLTRKLPNTLNLSFENVDGELLLAGLRGLAVSSGAACTSALPVPSHVLRAMGVSDTLAHASLRFSLGRWTTEDEIDRATARVVEVVRSLRRQIGAPV